MDYGGLHCHSYYSLLDGTSSPAELVARAADLGMDTLALTDHDALHCAVPFVTAASAAARGCAATNNARNARRVGRGRKVVRIAIREGTPLDAAGAALRPNPEDYLKTGTGLLPLFSAYPNALPNSRHIAERCAFQ